MTFDKEKRIAQLKACAQTIIDQAEEIIGDYEYSQSWQIVIDFPCRELPTIKVENRFISRKMIDAL